MPGDTVPVRRHRRRFSAPQLSYFLPIFLSIIFLSAPSVIDQIERIDFAWRGAIGGISTAARVQFQGPVKVLGGAHEESYDPAKMTTWPAAWEFRRKWETHLGGKIPEWFDFPFDQPMRMIRDVREQTKDSPSELYEWYIDDRRNVVYFLYSWG